MQMLVDIPESAVREAETRGIAIETLVHERLNREVRFSDLPGFTRFGTGDRPAEAAADIRELRKGQTLGSDVTIAQLIEEGRRGL